jgi:hypothetical protein
MKKPLILLAMLLAACGLVASDSTDNLRADAEWMCKAVKDGNADAIVQYTYPGLLEKVGGPDEMRKIIVAGQTDLAQRGLIVQSVLITAVSEPLQAGSELHAVVRTERTIRGKTGRQIIKSYVIAVSSDNGENWTFVDGQKLTPPHVLALFPDFNTDLVLPAPSEPVFERDPS